MWAGPKMCSIHDMWCPRGNFPPKPELNFAYLNFFKKMKFK